MLQGWGLRWAPGAPSGSLGLCALGLLGACSFINHFDDVKPTGAGGSSVATQAGGGPTGSAGSGDGTGGAGVGGSQGGPGGRAAGTNGGAGGANAGGATTGGGGNSGGAAGSIDSGIADAPTDTRPRVLQCRFLIGSPTGGHRKLDDYSTFMSTDRTLADKFYMTPTGNGSSVRIIVQLRGQQNSYFQYFASDSGMPFPAQVIASGGRLLDGRKLDPNSTGALVLATNNQPAQLMLHKFDDASQSSMPVISPMTNQGDLGTSGNTEARFSPALDGTIALGISYDPVPGMSRAAFALYSGAPARIVQLFDDPISDHVRPNALVRIRPNDASYGFYGQNPQQEYEIRDGARTVADTSHRTIMGNGFILMSDLDSMGSLNLVMADLGTVMNPMIKLLVGQFDRVQANSFLPSSLIVAKQAASLADVPVGSLTGLNDDLLLFAGPTGITRKELSIWFVDVWGQTRAEQKLQDTAGEVTNGIVVPRGMGAGALGRFHLAWSETMTDMSGNKYDILYYDQLECL